MDLSGTISRLLNLYAIFKSKNFGNNGVGFYSKRYSLHKGVGFLFVVLSAPRKPAKGKEKDLEVVLDKSSNSNKIIQPKDFIGVRNYLSTIFSQITRPADQIADIICDLIAGFRLELVPFQNMKYTFNDPTNPDIIIYDDDKDGQFSFYINIVNVKETGLILAYERQLTFIKEQIKKGINPITIKNLPPLRTGTTEIELRNKHEKNTPAGIQKLHQAVQGKKTQEEISKELGFETVIDSFPPEKKNTEAPTQPAAVPKPNAPNKMPGPQGFFQKGPTQPTPAKPSTPAPKPFTKPSSNPFDQVKNLIASDFPSVEEPAQDTKFVVDPEVEKLKKELNAVQQKLEKVKLESDNFQADKHRLEVENELITKQLQETTDALTLTIQKKEEELKTFKSLSSQNQESSVKLITQMQDKDTEIQQLTQKNHELQENLNFMKTQVENFQQILTEKEMVIQQISKENGQVSDSLDQLMNERNEFEEKFNKSQTDFEKFHKQKDEFDKKMLELTEENEQLAEALKEADMKYLAIFEEHKNCLKKQIKAENPNSSNKTEP